MGKVVVGMTMSLDGFVNDRAGSVAQLYPDLAALPESEALHESILNTGAVVMGRRTFEMGDADFYADHYEYQVPIFVVTHHRPLKQPRETDRLHFTFVLDGVGRAIELARIAAGDKDVTVVGGPNIIQQCLHLKLADELHIDIMPVLLGDGQRLFDANPMMLLETPKVLQYAGRTSLQFRIQKSHLATSG